jgi:serine/threonine-protein kinase
LINADSNLDPVNQSEKAGLDVTEMFAQGRDDDAEAHEPPAGGATEVFTQVAGESPAKGATNLAGDAAATGNPKPSAGAGAPASTGAAATGPPSSKALQKTGSLGDYRLIKKLGAGGMGTVYLAQQASLERTVALKVLSKELAAKPAFVQRFQREARLMARLDHPNILRCLDVGAFAGHHYLAMEYVDGGSLQDWLKKLTKFELGDALHVTLACARALQHAHDLNMIHRDVKPDNLLLTGKGVVKLADLGLAKASDDDLSLTRTGTGAGTPLYMAPEQARDAKNVDHRSDIYAIGCMLYCFLTGKLPFAGETLLEVIEAKTKGKFTPARRLNGEIPPRLDLILDKTLAPNPNHRYQSCGELVADLEALELANDHLSFLGPAAAARKQAPDTAGPKSATRPPATSTPPRPSQRPAPATGPADPQAEPASGDSWFIRLPLPGGKTVDKKTSRADLVALIKDGTLTADTKVGRTLTGAYRNASTHPELSSLIQSMSVKAASDRKSQKYRELYAQIEQEGDQRRRSQWLRNLKARLGGFVGFVFWMFFIAGLLAGGVYGVWWLIQKYGS